MALSILPWVIWAFYHKKESTGRLLFAGFFSIIIAKLLDTIGANFSLWNYTARVIPLVPPMMPWDTTLMPVAVMMLMQFKPKLHPAIKAVAFAVTASFIMEPLAVWMGLYKPIAWRHIYSFPIFTLIYLVSDWLSRRVSFDKISTG